MKPTPFAFPAPLLGPPRQIASWRGGAVATSGGQAPQMDLQLGLVRVAGYGIIAGSLGLKVRWICSCKGCSVPVRQRSGQ